MQKTKQEIIAQAKTKFAAIDDNRTEEVLKLLDKHGKLEKIEDVMLPPGMCHFRSALIELFKENENKVNS